MLNIVLVEDEFVIRAGLKQLVEEVIGGCKVIGEAGNGREALELLKTKRPDLLITDIRMNEMNGIELIKRIRELYSDLKVIVISGHADFEYAKQAIRYGISDYLLKPIDRVELTRFLNQLKSDKQALEGAADDVEQEKGSSQGRQLIRKVKELINARLDQEISLQVIAEQVHLNHQYLSVLFKSETGQNFSDYVTQCRMNKAKELLQDTNLKIYEVASLSGYASAKHFMTVFKQTVGLTPSEFRDNPQTPGTKL